MTKHARITDADKLDRYYTPTWATLLLLERLDQLDEWSSDATVAEPCAGQGHIVAPLRKHGHDVIAGDIDPESSYPQVDALSDRARGRYASADWVITNPPYSAATGSATDVIESMMRLGKPMAVLLRITWLEPCSARAGLLSDPVMSPDEITVLPRVHYEGPAGGKGNPATSCWVLWLGCEGPCEMRWLTTEDRDRIEGQRSLL